MQGPVSRRSDSPLNYQELYLRTPVMMHSIDSSGRLVTVSDFWLEVLGYSREEVIGQLLIDFFTESSRIFAKEIALPRFFRLGKVKEVPYQMVKKNGEVLDVLVSASSECSAAGDVCYSMAGIVDVTQRKKAEEEAQRLAHFDSLTGQPNRYLLMDRLEHALAQAEREGHKVGVMFVDLDRFKWVNDTLGHAAGDTLLKMVAARLQGCVRKADTVARFGGDEFVVLLYGFDDEDEPSSFAQRFLNALSEPIILQGIELDNSASIGIALYPLDGRDAGSLLSNADAAMYRAKELGRNTYKFFSPWMNARVKEKLGMENRLRNALKAGELFLEYQPQLDLRNCRVTGFEALVRWRDPQEGVIPPARFIPIAEETGLIYPLGEWILRSACEQARAWQRSGYQSVRVAVNISPKQLQRYDFIEMVETILAETGLPADCLEIEMTESMIMANIQEAITTLTDLKVRHIHLAIDDFGTGHSSLVYLKHFPFDRIKIAKEFIHAIPDDVDDMAIVHAILVMANILKLDVIAEGVEKRSQLDFLRGRHCNDMQGFYFSPPMSAGEMTGFLRQGGNDNRICPYNSLLPLALH